jgi:hypothetical protein
MIIQIATTVVFAAACLATIATIAAGPAGAARLTRCGEAGPDSESERCVRVLGCAPERARQQALRVVTGRERRFPPSAEAKGVQPDHRSGTAQRVPRELQSGLSA